MVEIIGGGLAGCEAALQLAARGIDVRLHEMRPDVSTGIHTGAALAELVCSNSFKSTNIDSAAGLLKSELALLGSRLLGFAFECRIPAGGALAVDRHVFSALVERAVLDDPHIEVVRDEVVSLQPFIDSAAPAIVAAGPLCSRSLARDISKRVGSENLAFFDAAAPIVEADSLVHDRLFAQSRHDRGGGADYLNAPLDKATYDAFVGELVRAERVIAHDFDRRELFNACQPVEQVARSGHDALRYGALKPVGLTDPATGRRPWAAVQLRAENAGLTAYNLVGFQTNLTFPEQERVFRMIPGLENAVFSRHGVMHRNTFIDSPHALGTRFELPDAPHIVFAGQICGTEGYLEAVASGLAAAVNVFAMLNELPPLDLPRTTALGSLFAYATDPACEDYQPMHVNYGIIDPLEVPQRNKRERYAAYSLRARHDLAEIIRTRRDLRFPCWQGPDLEQVSEADSRAS